MTTLTQVAAPLSGGLDASGTTAAGGRHNVGARVSSGASLVAAGRLWDSRSLRVSALLSADLVAAALVPWGAGLGGYAVDRVTAAALPLLWLACLLAARAHESLPVRPRFVETAGRIARAGGGLALLVWVLSTAVGAVTRPETLWLAAGATALSSTLLRAAPVVWRARPGAAQRRRTRVLVAGHSLDVSRALAELRATSGGSVEVVAVCVPRAGLRDSFDVPVSVGLDRIAGAAAAAHAEAVIALPCRHLDARSLRRLGWHLEASGAHLYVGTPLFDVAPQRATVTATGGLRMLHVRATARRGPSRLLKPALDRTAAALLLLILMPVLAVVAVAVARDSAGPVIFRQPRVGRNGRHFTMYKFRTMRVDADATIEDLAADNEADGVLFKIRTDPRITRLGALLRRYSVDELPQLANVLLGQMSLVGPRPALPTEVARYGHDPLRRLAVKPGLTGLWQVSGRSDLSWDDAVRLDLKYVDNWSLTLDLMILFRTVSAVLNHRGAY